MLQPAEEEADEEAEAVAPQVVLERAELAEERDLRLKEGVRRQLWVVREAEVEACREERAQLGGRVGALVREGAEEARRRQLRVAEGVAEVVEELGDEAAAEERRAHHRPRRESLEAEALQHER